MGDEQAGDNEEMRLLAAAVDEACRPATRRPRPWSALRDTVGTARPSAAEVIQRLRARRAGHDQGHDEGPEDLPSEPPGAAGA